MRNQLVWKLLLREGLTNEKAEDKVEKLEVNQTLFYQLVNALTVVCLQQCNLGILQCNIVNRI